jgi:hypothetical protein
LITQTEAARIVYGASNDTLLARIRRMIERGALRHYWRPGRAAPQHAVLVRRSEVKQVQQHQHEDERYVTTPSMLSRDAGARVNV